MNASEVAINNSKHDKITVSPHERDAETPTNRISGERAIRTVTHSRRFGCIHSVKPMVLLRILLVLDLSLCKMVVASIFLLPYALFTERLSVWPRIFHLAFPFGRAGEGLYSTVSDGVIEFEVDK